MSYHGLKQKQRQLDKQKVLLRQNQNSSNMIMCRVLSELENLAFYLGFNGPKYFGYYATTPKNINDIINQILIQMKIFESSYKHFISNHHRNYEFPNNLTYQNIIAIVNNWKNDIQKNAYTIYFDDFLNIFIQNGLNQNFNYKFETLGNNSIKISKSELRRIMNAGVIATCFTNEKYSDIENEIMEKGDYKVNVVIGGKREDNEFYKKTDNDKNRFEKLKKELNDYLELTLKNLELHIYLNSSRDKFMFNYNENINKTNLNKKKIYNDYCNYLDEYYKKNDEIYNEFSYDISKDEKNKIKSVSEYWRKMVNDRALKNEIDKAIKGICNNKHLNI